MRTTQSGLLEFLGQSGIRFTIPYYQRAYAWTERQCDELWTDIMRAGRQGTSHFVSMLLYLPAEGLSANGLQELDIIDGQQRIATSTILLQAFVDWLQKTGSTVEGVTPAEIRERYITCDAAGSCKIRLMGTDLTTLQALIDGVELPVRTSPRVVENYAAFRKHMETEGFDPSVFWAGMQRLLIIGTELEERDKAQAVFESLNTKGIPLTTADLIRNYLLVGETREQQEYLYQEYWSPMEIMFEPDPGKVRLNTGFRMWLAIRYRGMRMKDRNMTYTYFKKYMEEKYDGTTEELLDELRSFCLLWAQNYKCNEGRGHCSSMPWAKKGRQTLLPEGFLKGRSGCGPG